MHAINQSCGSLIRQKKKERKKKKLFGCPPLPAPVSFENWKKVFTVQKYTAPNFQNSKKVFFFFDNFDL